MAVITRYCLKKKMKLTRMYEKRCNLLRFSTLNSTFHMFNGAAYPYKLSRLISLTLFDLCFTIEQLYQWRYSTYTIGIFRQINFSQEAVRLTGEIPVFLACPDVDPMHSPKIGYSLCSQ